MESTGHSQQFTGTMSGQHRHICAFFNSVDEQHRVLRPFIKDGFDRGDKAYHYVDPERQEEHLSWLADAGINVQEAMGTGQLEVRPWQDSTLRGGRFDLDTWLASFEQVLQSGPAAGYAQTSFLGHMEWALLDLPGVGDLIEYETRVNYVIPKYDGPVICTYDLTKFGASVVMDALRTHPFVIIGGLLQENPFFVSPDQLLLEIRSGGRSARAQARRSECPSMPMPRSIALRTVLRDLVALSAIPVAWIGREPAAVAAGLVDVLTGLLRLDFVFVRLCVPGVDGAVDVTRGNAWKAFPEWLEKHLAESGWFSSMEIIPDVGGGVEPYRGVVIPVGVNGEGMVAAACDRAGFPTETDQLLLRLAANHAATAFQSAALVHERMRAEERAPPGPGRAGDEGGRADRRAADKRSLLVRGAAADPYRHGRSGRRHRGGNPLLRRALPPVRLRSRTRSPLFRRVSPARSPEGSCGVDRIAQGRNA